MKALNVRTYAVRVAANGHWSADRRTIRVHADSAAKARDKALQHHVVQGWPERQVLYTKRMPA